MAYIKNFCNPDPHEGASELASDAVMKAKNFVRVRSAPADLPLAAHTADPRTPYFLIVTIWKQQHINCLHF